MTIGYIKFFFKKTLVGLKPFTEISISTQVTDNLKNGKPGEWMRQIFTSPSSIFLSNCLLG